MDATLGRLEAEKERLLARLAEISVQQQRLRGEFATVPHMTSLEEVSHALGQRLGAVSLQRAVREVVAGASSHASCPACDCQCELEMSKRTVQGLDGPTELLEPKGHCPACRRDFFPSAGSPGA